MFITTNCPMKTSQFYDIFDTKSPLFLAPNCFFQCYLDISEIAKDNQLLLAEKIMLFFVYCEISIIFTGLTHFLPVMADGPMSFATTAIWLSISLFY